VSICSPQIPLGLLDNERWVCALRNKISCHTLSDTTKQSRPEEALSSSARLRLSCNITMFMKVCKWLHSEAYELGLCLRAVSLTSMSHFPPAWVYKSPSSKITGNSFISHIFHFIHSYYTDYGQSMLESSSIIRGSVVVWGTVLKAGRSRVQFPVRSLDFFIFT
jgi:hypothetical protein